jgi:hypothetical protein
MILEGEDKHMRVLVKLRHLGGEADLEGARLKGFSADVFIELKGRFRSRPRAAAAPRIPAQRPETVRTSP